jgi:serine/threonine protein phosphatase PrpC
MAKLGFQTAVLSHKGGRKQNEDFLDYRLSANHGCWVLADGLGGHGGGEVAANLAVESLIKAFESAPECSPQALSGYVSTAHASVNQRRRADAQLAEMRSTLVVLVSDYEHALWAHVGDSRLYHLRKDRICFQTLDHSVPQALCNAGEITTSQIRFHEDRNRLTRSLGGEDPLRPTILEQALTFEPRDSFLLCSDGFWEYVTESEIEEDRRAASGAEDWLKKAAGRLALRPPENYDNYSAIAITVTTQ